MHRPESEHKKSRLNLSPGMQSSNLGKCPGNFPEMIQQRCLKGHEEHGESGQKQGVGPQYHGRCPPHLGGSSHFQALG